MKQTLYYLLTSFEVPVNNDIKRSSLVSYSCLLSAADTLSSLLFAHAVSLLMNGYIALDVPSFLLKSLFLILSWP